MRAAITDPISCTACHRGPALQPTRPCCPYPHPARAPRVGTYGLHSSP